MITGALRSKVDRLWDEFWTGGISNPLSVIEQITYLIFLRRLDERETADARPHLRRAPGKPYYGLFGADEQNLRWQHFKNLGGEEMLRLVGREVFDHLKRVGGEYMKDAVLLIMRPSLLVSAVRMIDQLPLTGGDTKGDLYEYMLSKLNTAGVNGQFRTPRHVIRTIVDLALADVQGREALTWRVCDPACGTAGFLVSVMEHLMERYTSEAGRLVEGEGSEQQITHTGDLLEPAERQHLTTDALHGFDFDVTMLRIGAMNLALHGADPDRATIYYQDALSNSFPDRFPKLSEAAFDLVLANPPFKGSLDASDVHPSLTRVAKTRKTELLFVALMLRLLKLGGRCAIIVPDGVLFGSSNAHVSVRKALVEDNQLEAVVKLPAGVFKPYAGVSTAVLMFRKGGRTDHVWFYDVQADGYSLDDKRDPVPENDLPDVLARWKARNPKTDTDRTAKAFFVPKADIVAQDYDLSLNRYKEVVHEEVKYDPPKVILEKLKALEAEIAKDLKELEGML
ncbi:type I restriction-modification system subunit M [Gemmata sp. JC673]|uniref:site-specific DNA-methyltransferase (adenine-specific) n=1 Tax=Gemmata algarum TaxID=2975278 RepID=A0ABU5F7H7_9BACT|nr:class I SAM-dependent DNA methyltransferase [Gemmata algarum]MDY3562697.1 type I restriction-modification system subunit M [Gemmata algarum]